MIVFPFAVMIGATPKLTVKELGGFLKVIVASAGAYPAGGLPSISYVAGGLEDASVREAVCNILEGGEEAFRERARRLRVRLDR